MDISVIHSKIYTIRGHRVMLDFDLARMYHVTTGNLNKAVKRNIKRFPPDFMFQLTNEELLIFQNGTSRWGGTRKLPNAFTEQGLAMLSGILNSDVAIEVNISIMRAFVAVRQLLSSPDPIAIQVSQLRQYIEELFCDQNDINEDTRTQIELINATLAELQIGKKTPRPRPVVGFIRPKEEGTITKTSQDI